MRSIDRLLRRDFGIAEGLADSGERVIILDPAAGTGTFLRETIVRIRETVETKGRGGAWTEYVRQHLLPRIHGFELLMAPYAICHLRLALDLGGEARAFQMPLDTRLNVFLTNTLEGRTRGAHGPGLYEIAREAQEAEAVKREKPVMVVLGNPPYSGHSANKGAWIADLMRGRIDGSPESYFTVDGGPLGERNPKWLNDDYVKFIRFAQWRIERTGEGVLGFVTNHGYLDNPTYRGMRQSLMATFDEIHLLDLHGNARRKERAPDGGPDQNVFDIQQGVAIGLFVKRRDGDEPARVFHADLWGPREGDGGKYGQLDGNDVETTEWTELTPRSPYYFFVPRDEALEDEYGAGWKLTDILPINSAGIVTARDKLTIQWSDDEMRRTVREFGELPEEAARERWRLGPDRRDWKVALAQEDVRGHPDTDDRVVPILYRPFDERFTWYSGRSRGFICMPRPEVMRHMLSPNLGLTACRQQSQSGPWTLCGVTRRITGHRILTTYDLGSLFPLYVYPASEDSAELDIAERTPNLAPEFTDAVAAATGLAFTPDGAGDLAATFGPEDVFHWCYAVLHSPEYRRRYADFLKADFPRVPLPANGALFAELAALGAQLAALHLLDVDGPTDDAPTFDVGGTNRVDRVRYTEPTADAGGRVWINRTQYFEGVAPETWAFTIGGYRPAEKWLKDRRGRPLDYDDIGRYQRICVALAETPRLMARIDEAIAAHGGWPIG